ncbi:MAG: DnaJ domain-containing protein [Xanthobacteraceae bacterium]
MPFILGVAVLVLLLLAGNSFTKANPKQVAALLRKLGGALALIAAGFMVLRGEIAVAIPVGLFGFGLLGWSTHWMPSFGSRAQKSTGQTSQVRTAFLDMQLDHDSGKMRGRVLAGRYEGVSLDALDMPALAGLFKEIDDDSRSLLAAYLDRRNAGWREHAQADAGARSGWGGPPRSGKMTEEEAYQILGIQPGATTQDITRAHRTLMKKLHPDQGGTTYLAARVNEAKDVLLRRHR